MRIDSDDSSPSSTFVYDEQYIGVGGNLDSSFSANRSSILEDVLESVDTLPAIKYVASIGIKTVELVNVRYLWPIASGLFTYILDPRLFGKANQRIATWHSAFRKLPLPSFSVVLQSTMGT